jgi:hypothetical protein
VFKDLSLASTIDEGNATKMATYISKKILEGNTFEQISSELLNAFANIQQRADSKEEFAPTGIVIDSWLKVYKNFNNLKMDDFNRYLTAQRVKYYTAKYIFDNYLNFQLIPKELWLYILPNFVSFMLVNGKNEVDKIDKDFFEVTSKDDKNYDAVTGIGNYIGYCIVNKQTNKIPAPWLEHLQRFVDRGGDHTRYGGTKKSTSYHNLLSRIFEQDVVKIDYDTLPIPVQKLILLNKTSLLSKLISRINGYKEKIDLKILAMLATESGIKSCFEILRRWKRAGYDVDELPVEIRIEANKAYAQGYINPFTDSWFQGENDGIIEEFQAENIRFREQNCFVTADIEIGYNLEAEEYEYASSSVALEPSIGYTGKLYVVDFEVWDVKNIVLVDENDSEYTERDMSKDELFNIQKQVIEEFEKVSESYLEQFSEDADDRY